jgi:hypothetical protein
MPTSRLEPQEAEDIDMRTSLSSIIELHRRADQCTRLMRSVTDVQTKAALLLLAADIHTEIATSWAMPKVRARKPG